MNNIGRQSILSNLIWRFAERCGAQLVSFVVSIILARLLVPDVYGTIALVTVLIAVLNVFVDSGLGNSLIQKKDADELDFSTVFYVNIIVCIILYGLVFFVAPFISRFYQDDSLTPIIRVLSITLVISGVKNIQQAYVSRTMQFKRFFFSTIGGTLGAAVVGIIMAYKGAGVWALVAQQLFNAFAGTIILWVTVKWRPKRKFSIERLKGLFSYGWKLLVSSLIDTVYNNITQLIVGKVYTSSDLAFYNRGRQFPEFVVININSSIDSVLLPAMSNAQENPESVKAMTRRSIKISTYIMAPLMIGLCVCAESVVKLILTDKWVGCVPFLRIFCLTYIFYPIHTANLNAIKAMGRSDLFLKLETIKKIIGVISLVLAVRINILVIAGSMLLSSIISLFLNAFYNKKLLSYGFCKQIKDIYLEILIASFMGIFIFFIGKIDSPLFFKLCLQIVIGGITYIVLSFSFKSDSFEYLHNLIKHFFRKSFKEEIKKYTHESRR